MPVKIRFSKCFLSYTFNSSLLFGSLHRAMKGKTDKEGCKCQSPSGNDGSGKLWSREEAKQWKWKGTGERVAVV